MCFFPEGTVVDVETMALFYGGNRMQIVNAVATIFDDKSEKEMLKRIELFGRICYKSEHKITEDSCYGFVKGLIKRGHLAVIEHESIGAIVIADRGVTHEIVRHRIGSYCQESTRYVNYKEEIQVVRPLFWKEDSKQYAIWKEAMERAEESYIKLIESGAKPEEARSVLPHSLSSEIAITYNLREWRHFFELRCSKYAHPQIRQVAQYLLEDMIEFSPTVFGDLHELLDWSEAIEVNPEEKK